MVQQLKFSPFPGLGSPHLQMIVSAFCFKGEPPFSKEFRIELEDGDILSCQLSMQENLTEGAPTVIFVHGLGGSHASSYLIRLSRKFYFEGYRVLRINLRGCGSGSGLAKKPYNAGTSHDVLKAIKKINLLYPFSPISLVGFSLGGNLVLKLAGELGDRAEHLIDKVIAICPTIDLYKSVKLIEKPSNWIYHHYYLSNLLSQGVQWAHQISIKSIYEFDDKITAPNWGFKDAMDYYRQSSAKYFIPEIRIPTRILFAEDDPFIDTLTMNQILSPPSVSVYHTQKGGHMGFIGKDPFFWLDHLLKEWMTKCIPNY